MNDELAHHGVKGMKWGVRRVRKSSSNSSKKRFFGSKNEPKKTPAKTSGTSKTTKRKSVNNMSNEEIRKQIERMRLEQEYKSVKNSTRKTTSKPKTTTKQTEEPKKKSVKEMSDEELQRKINRLQLEQRYSQLNPEQVSKGRKFVNSLGRDVLAPAAKEVGKKLITQLLTEGVEKSTGVKLSNEKKKKD